VFTKYMSRFKDTSDVSPSMSKSTIDSDAALLAEGVQPSAPTNPPSSKDAAHCATDTLDFDTEEFTPSEDKREPVAPIQIENCNPSHAAVVVPLKKSTDICAGPATKDVVPKKPEVASQESKAGDLKVESASMK
jgi:hypothetical protein